MTRKKPLLYYLKMEIKHNDVVSLSPLFPCGVLYGTKAFKIKNPNSNPGFKNMTKIVRFLIGSKGRRSERRLLTNFQLPAFRTAGFDFSKSRRCERRLLTNSIADIPDDGY